MCVLRGWGGKLTCFGGAEGVRENEIKRKQRHENRDGKREKGVLQGENEKREGEEFKDMRFKERGRQREREMKAPGERCANQPELSEPVTLTCTCRCTCTTDAHTCGIAHN